jgi:acetyl esterase/lipase
MRRSRSRVVIVVAFVVVFLALCGAGAFAVFRDTGASTARGTVATRTSVPEPQAGSGEERGIVFVDRNGESLDLDVFHPPLDGQPKPALILVHGGGWRKGGDNSDVKRASGNEMEPTALALRDTLHMPVFDINYRLKEHPGYPAEVDDVQAAVEWVRANGSRWDVDGTRIALLGSSAGGNLSLVEGLRGEGALDTGSRVAAIVSWSGPTDLAALVGSGEQQPVGYLGCTPDACADLYDAASAVKYVDPTDPPVYLFNSLTERIPTDQPLILARKLLAAGVTTEVTFVQGSQHGVNLARDHLAEVTAFLQRAFGLPDAPPAPPPPDLDALQSQAN